MKAQTFQEKKNAYLREWYKKHPEKYYEYQIRYYQKKLDQLKSQAVINKPS